MYVYIPPKANFGVTLFCNMPPLLGTACRRDPTFNAVLKARRAHLSRFSEKKPMSLSYESWKMSLQVG